MRDKDCGFLPVSDEKGERLEGMITDRDIAISAVADGWDPKTKRVEEMLSHKVLYCYQENNIEEAAHSMSE